MPFNVGENIGPYRIIEQFGQGGMATVFKAYHASLDRYVALKVLHPAFNQDPNFETRFQREARVVAKLDHPNIVPVYDYAEHEKRPYLVMKFIEGITLKARMDQGPLLSGEITKIVDAVGSALAYAHKQGVLHRDIKPSNVLLASDGQVYLADFGLARIAQSGESTLSSDMIMGTPQYISPEQAMGRADLDQRTDLYSFGVMLYEMVVGKVPFNADTPFSIIHDHIYSPLPLPQAVNPEVPQAIERVLLKVLAKDRDDRFEDASTLVSGFKAAWNEAGRQIQGQDAVALKSLSIESSGDEQSVQTKGSRVPEPMAPSNIPGAPATIVENQEKTSKSGRDLASKKGRFPVIWVGAALVIILCIGALAIARNNRLFGRLFSASRSNDNAPLVVRPSAAPETSEPPAPPKAPAVLIVVSASNTEDGSDPYHVVDGDIDSAWVSGGHPEQWVLLDLGRPRNVAVIRLVVSQDPPGPTLHQIWGGAERNNLSLLHEFAGRTAEFDVLTLKPPSPYGEIRFIRVATLESPSWVGWREIEVELVPSK